MGGGGGDLIELLRYCKIKNSTYFTLINNLVINRPSVYAFGQQDFKYEKFFSQHIVYRILDD